MKERFIPAFVMLLAGTITIIIEIVQSVEVLSSLEILLGVLILFYIIGLVAKRIISQVNRSVSMKEAYSEEPIQFDLEEEQGQEEGTSSNEENV